VFEVNAATGQTTVLYNFQGQTDGGLPGVGVVTDGEGNLYGTTGGGGSGDIGSSTSYGVVFKLDITTHLETVLYTFPLSKALGLSPGGLARDPQGNLYGTTAAGGSYGYGTVFELDTAGNLTTLYNFTGGPDGTAPGGVVRAPNGDLYGTATPLVGFGGTVFKIAP
jgi:uncharacterized repeat protein (TIGR03803 family)